MNLFDFHYTDAALLWTSSQVADIGEVAHAVKASSENKTTNVIRTAYGHGLYIGKSHGASPEVHDAWIGYNGSAVGTLFSVLRVFNGTSSWVRAAR